MKIEIENNGREKKKKKELEHWAKAAGKQGKKRVWGTTGWTSLDSVSGPVTHVEAQLNSIRCIYTQTVCVCVSFPRVYALDSSSSSGITFHSSSSLNFRLPGAVGGGGKRRRR